MSKHGDPDIDLYADDSEFNTENDFNHDGNVDLYDDVISAPSEDPNGEGRPSSRGGSSSPHRHVGHTGRKRAAVYVGNLTWWTTDKDMIDALHNIGVNDVLDVKFFENRANGQSKGFCVISLSSENSLRIVMEKFAKKEIHGQVPVVTSYTRQNLNYFESQSRKGGRHERDSMNERRSRDRDRERERDGSRGMPSERSRSRSDPPQPYPQQRPPPHPHMQHPPPQGPPPPQYQTGRAPWMSAPPPQIHQMPPPPASRPGMPPTGVPPLPPGMQSVPPPRPGPPPPGNIRVPPPNSMRGPMPPMGPRQLPPPDSRGPPPSHEWERPNVSQPPPQQVGMPPQIGPPNRPPPPVPNPGQGMPPSIPPPAPHAPSPHINPAFFHQQGVPPGLVSTSQPTDMYSRPPVQFADYRPSNDRAESSSNVSEGEFEEIMGRNRTVSSSAIGRAVADASAGDYASAIETLVTAISLIKQSKVANDERCKILISSLQDTLHGIESKSYGSRSKERARSRERERSRERPSRREKSSRRDRSRSRDREYRDRSRERDRYHEDRYRDKDRDHDRDRRSSRH